MTLKAGFCVFSLVTLLGACGVGDETPPSEDPDGVLGAKCRAEYTVAGSFAEEQARPLDETGAPIGGCWGVGTWTFTVSMQSNECDYTPELKPQYQFRVGREAVPDEPENTRYTYAYLTEPGVNYRLKVTEGGALECSGSLELFSPDGMKVWLWKPSQGGSTINGSGEFTEYDSNQWQSM